MPQDLLLMEEVDVRRADDPTGDTSKVLTITKMALVTPERKEAEHTPGGGVGTVNFLLPMLNALEPKFSVKGIDRDAIRGFGFVPGAFDKWTFAATLRNTRTNEVIPVRSTLRGLISTWAPGEHTPGELIDCDHTLKEVTYADLVVDGEELFAWGFYERIARSGGIDWFARYRNALGA
jgi:P2 family phage contractile tail tube protein